MKKVFTYGLVIILVIIGSLYTIPVHQQTFADLYDGDAGLAKSLAEFRKRKVNKLTSTNVNWEYIATGEGSAHLLFIHGMGGAYDIWWQQIDSLKKDFSIISVTVPAVHSLEDAATGIIAILDAENVDKISIVGTSMGGYIAQYLCTKYPQLVNNLVLGNTFPPNDYYREENGTARKIVPLLPEWLVMAQFRANIATAVTSGIANSDLVSAYLLEQYSGLMSKQQFIGRFDIVLDDFEVARSPEHIAVPKLIIESGNDPLVTPALRDRLKKTYPEADVFTFDDKGHFSYLNDPQTYNKVLSEFLLR